MVDVLNLEQADGTEVAVWLSSRALAEQAARLQPKVGALVVVVYEGDAVSASGNRYRRFRLAVDQADSDGQPDWGSVADRAADLGDDF
jgi:hypothetical protein